MLFFYTKKESFILTIQYQLILIAISLLLEVKETKSPPKKTFKIVLFKSLELNVYLPSWKILNLTTDG
jgi:hypothetical protein